MGKNDLERCGKRGYDMTIERVAMVRLIHREPLDPICEDHPLEGEWNRHRECHLRPDRLLLYRVDPTVGHATTR